MEGAIVVGAHLWRYRSWFERLEATAKYGNKYNLFFLNRKIKLEKETDIAHLILPITVDW